MSIFTRPAAAALQDRRVKRVVAITGSGALTAAENQQFRQLR